MDYINGKIYTIRNTVNNQLYVGSTTVSLSARMSQHRRDSKKEKKMNYKLYKAFKEHGIENFYIELVELFHCETRDHLRAREGYYIRQFDSYREGYNGLVAGRTDNDYKKENRLQIIEKSAQYYKENKARIQEYKKCQYQENKVKVIEKQKMYRAKKQSISKSNPESIIVNLRETDGGIAFTIHLQ